MHWKKDALPTFIFRSRPERVDNPPVWERVEDSRLLEVKRLEAQASHFYDPYTIPPTEIAGYLGTLHCSLCPRSGLEQDELDEHFHRWCVWMVPLIPYISYTESGSIAMQTSSTPTNQKGTSTGLCGILCPAP